MLKTYVYKCLHYFKVKVFKHRADQKGETWGTMCEETFIPIVYCTRKKSISITITFSDNTKLEGAQSVSE